MAGLVSKWCKGCAHLSVDCCLYILHGDKLPRPCPAGEGCTEHTEKQKKGKETMLVKKRWDMVLAARLLQYGASGKEVARVVGCTAPEISRAKAELLAMAGEPMSDTEAEQLIGKNEPFKPESDAPKIEPAAEAEDETMTAEANHPSPCGCHPLSKEGFEVPQPVGDPAPKIMVDIHIGRGMVHLEAESARVLETLINMLVAMGSE